MKFLNIIKNGCVIFAVITLLFYSIGGIVSGAEQEFIPKLAHIWMFFAFSVLLAFANEILKSEKFGIAARLGIHFISTAAIYFVTVVLCGGYIKNGAQTVVALTLFAVLYFIFAILYLIFTPKKKKAQKKYEKMF